MTLSLSFSNTEMFSKGFGDSRMYTFEPPIFVFRSVSAGSPSPVSIQNAFAVCCTRRCVMPLGFCLVAFPPPPVTFPVTRLNTLRHERLSTQQADHFPRALSVFIRITRSAFRLISASLSASVPGVQDSGFPLLLSSNGVSPPPFHLPVPVKMPVSNLDCDAILHR